MAGPAGIYRILDANLNRSREGLRVCEDISRFVLNSGAISARLKSIRHAVTALMTALPEGRAMLLRSRDSDNDVSAGSRTATEMRRADAADIFFANIQRAKESLRVLEEFSKLADERAASGFRRLRFRVYGVEKDTMGRTGPLRHTGRLGPR
jgi:thiamine-phosphate pyrophosphorylase